jgi:AbrB family looped-hinge helix DNA binding protein
MVESAFDKPEFYGSTTVGERGQVVLPASLRKKFNIKPGDKLLVMGHKTMGGALLVKAEVLSGFLEMMDEHINEFRGKIKAAKGTEKV